MACLVGKLGFAQVHGNAPFYTEQLRNCHAQCVCITRAFEGCLAQCCAVSSKAVVVFTPAYLSGLYHVQSLMNF